MQAKNPLCPICQEVSFYYGVGFGEDIRRCHKCKFLFFEKDISSLPNSSLNWYAEISSLSDKQITCFIDEVGGLYGKQLDVLEGITEERSLIDIGCGVGQFLVHAKRRGWVVSGEDSNTNIPIFLSKHFNIPCYASLRQIQPDSFSVVRAVRVLEHIVQPVSFIEEVGRIIKKDGIFMIIVPSGESLSALFVNFFRRLASRTPRLMTSLKPNFHVSGFSIRSLTRLLLNHNFSPVKVFTVSMGNRTYYPFFYDGLIKIEKPSLKEFWRSRRYYLPLLIDNIGNPFGLGFEVVGYFRKNS